MAQNRILIVSHSAGLYGAERSLLTTAGGLIDRGFDVTVLLPKRGPLHDELTDRRVRTIVWPYYGWLGRKCMSFRGAYRLIFNVFSSIIFFLRFRTEYESVYTNTITTSFGVLLSILKRGPHVWHVREFVHEDMGAEFDLPRSLLGHAFLKNNVLSIYNSQAVAHKFLRYFGHHKHLVIYNGILLHGVISDCSARVLDKSSSPRLVMMSSLHEGKGHMDAISALAIVRNCFPNACLIIGGGGSGHYKQKLIDKAGALGVEKNISFLGYVGDSEPLLSSADLFLMCSRSEAFGRVTIEAMSAGCPVIGAASGGTPELIESEVSGLLYPVGDHVNLARKIVRLLADPGERRKLSRAGLSRAADFDEGRYLDNIATALGKAFRSDSNCLVC